MPHVFEVDSNYSLLTPDFCQVCYELIIGFFVPPLRCVCCQFVIHNECLAKAKALRCRQKIRSDDGDDEAATSSAASAHQHQHHVHHFVVGNLPFGETCEICAQTFQFPAAEDGQRCSQCQTIVHVNDACLSKVDVVCKPTHELLLLSTARLWRENASTNQPTPKPLACFVNAKSGGGEGLEIAKQLCSLLSNEQIYLIDGDHSPEDGLRQFAHIDNLHLLVCGGDGTANWIMSALDNVRDLFPRNPPLAMLPLGTGNDLAQALGWVAVEPCDQQDEPKKVVCNGLSNHLLAIEKAQVIAVDRWQLEIHSGALFPFEKKKCIMTNYFSFGVDAQVCLKFHNLRESNPELFVSQNVNKFFYAHFGFTTIFNGMNCIGSKIDIKCDNIKLQIPDEIAGIIVLNIPSYAGGADLWGEDESAQFQAPSVSDGMLEILGVTGSAHMAIISVNLSNAIRLAQCSKLQLHFKEDDIPFHIDGEPHLRGKSKVTISRVNQVPMLLSPSKK